MIDAPLRVLSDVGADAIPVIEALQRLHRDVGSFAVRYLFPMADPPLDPADRIIAVACVDEGDVLKLSRDLSHELRDDPVSAALASKVAVINLVGDGGGCYVVGFVQLPCRRSAL
jgi:hypothetical protein